MTFHELGLSNSIADALHAQNIIEPTLVQTKCYPHILDNRDMIVCSGTGSGKTLSYLLPIITKLSPESKYIQALILVPTQELAVQVSTVTDTLLHDAQLPFTSIFLIGEGNINRQITSLKTKPSIVIGTPARVLQLINQKKLRVHDVKTLVLDEADRLLTRDNKVLIMDIRKSLLKYTQVLLYSASITKQTRQAANDLTLKPIVLDLQKEQKSRIPNTIKHTYILTDRRERIETLRRIAKAVNSKRTIIFINKKYDLDETLQKLQYHNYNVVALSGNQDKQQKKLAIERFKSGKAQYLLATDVAARGLQIDNVETVINLNLPEEAEEYLHRAGRCGRNGNTGVCISIITENEQNKIKQYQKEFHININQKRLYQGKLVAK